MKKTLIASIFTLTACSSGLNHPVERAERTFLNTFANQAMEEFHLHYLGLTTPPSNTIDTFGARFMTRKLYSLDEARKLMTASASQFMYQVNQSQTLKNYLKEGRFKPDQLDYYVSFWDENTDRPAKPYVALATIKDGKVTYYFKRDDSEFLDDTASITEEFGFHDLNPY